MKAPTKIFVTLCMAFVAILPLNNGYAIDMMNPPWVRPSDDSQGSGDTNTTFQEWIRAVDFLLIGEGQPFYGPNGPSSMLNVLITTPLLFSPNPMATINNFIDQEPLKWIYVQATTRDQINVALGFGGASIISAITTDPSPTQATLLNALHNQQIGDLFYSAELWQVSGGSPLINPQAESLIFVSNPSYTHIVVDTRSFNGIVPEPTTMAILGSSLVLGALAKRRKAKNVS